MYITDIQSILINIEKQVINRLFLSLNTGTVC